jgi:hypothetical protein
MGLLFLTFAFWSLSGIPKVIDNFNKEPEDLMILLVIFGLSLLVSIASLLISLVLFKQKNFFIVSAKKIIWLNMFAITILVFLSAVGYWSNAPSSKELIFLIFPALVLTGSCFFVKQIR